MINEPIYLDYHATTPCDPRVVQAMIPYFGESFGNPSSSVHRLGRIAADAVERARTQVASLIGAQAGEIVFTSGATESNNIALLGLARGVQRRRKRIVTTAVEHKAVLRPCSELRREGYETVVLPVDSEGLVDQDEARKGITSDTLVVSVQAANNEIGTIQEVRELACLAHERGAVIHCDAAQAVGKMPVDVGDWDVDMLSVSAHKLYGPKGVGGLYVRGGATAFPLKSLFFGGGQEHDLRPGTLNVPGIVGFGEASALCAGALEQESERIRSLRDRLEARLIEAIIHLRRNGAMVRRLPGNSNLTFPGIDAEAVIANAPGLALSTGSACTSGAFEPSHVLLAIGLSRRDAFSTIRVGLGRFTTEEEISQAAEMLAAAVARTRELMAIEPETY